MPTDNQQDAPDNWLCHMRQGNFDAAWDCADKTLRLRNGKPCWHLPRHFQYIWNGDSLQGKRVLVRCYHGLGDTIQFIRYARLVKAIAKQVIVWVHPKLIPLLKTVEGIDELLPLHDGSPEVSYDVDVELMELPHVFRSTLYTIPVSIPYLHVRPIPLSLSNKQLNVGLVWKAGDWDENRSIPFTFLSPLEKNPGIQFYILQPGAREAGWNEQFGIYPGELDLVQYARHVSALDLLISIDSMPVHVAGALSVPVWTLLQATPDWRWMDNREDSPWYPSMRLFRQQRPGDWEPVIHRVADELKKLTSVDK